MSTAESRIKSHFHLDEGMQPKDLILNQAVPLGVEKKIVKERYAGTQKIHYLSILPEENA